MKKYILLKLVILYQTIFNGNLEKLVYKSNIYFNLVI